MPERLKENGYLFGYLFKRLRNWKVALTLTLVIAFANLPLAYMAYRLFYVEPYIASLPEAVRLIANYEPFFSTWYGGSTIGIWLALIVLWAYHMHAKRKVATKPQKVAKALFIGVLCLLLGISILHLQLARCEWNVYRQVDVLMIGDEEFRAQPSWITNAENVLQDVSDDRFDQSHINFYARGWLAWDSSDGVTDSYDLMQEALAESGLPRKKVGFSDWGFIAGSEWIDGDGVKWWIDLLLIFSGQEIDMKGLSPPMCNMTIIHHDHVNLHFLTHELGHQYYLQHCGDPWCVMNVDWQFGDNFCSNCRNALNANRDKWLTDPEVFFGLYYFDKDGKIPDYYWEKQPGYFVLRFDGKTLAIPTRNTWWGWGNWMRIRCGTTVNIQIVPNAGFAYNNTYTFNYPPIIVSDPENPPSPLQIFDAIMFDFYLNDTWTFEASFYEVESSHCSGGQIPKKI